MKFCKNFRAILTAADGDKLLVTRTRCKQWDCPYCGLVNSNIWRARVVNGIDKLPAGDGWHFVTITSHENAHKYAKTLENLRGGFDRLYHRMRRAAGRKIDYVRIYEHHQSGNLHIHFLANWQTTNRWYKDNSRECGMGYQCRQRPIDSIGLAAWYIAKYLSKSLAGKPMSPNVRRINTSHGWPALPGDDSGKTWELKASIPEELLYLYNSVYDVTEKRNLEPDDFYDYGYYPPRSESEPH
jgi:hypothetical protein